MKNERFWQKVRDTRPDALLPDGDLTCPPSGVPSPCNSCYSRSKYDPGRSVYTGLAASYNSSGQILRLAHLNLQRIAA